MLWVWKCRNKSVGSKELKVLGSTYTDEASTAYNLLVFSVFFNVVCILLIVHRVF